MSELERREQELKDRLEEEQRYVYERDPDAGEVTLLAIDTRDSIVSCMARGTQAQEIPGWKTLKDWDTNIPVVFRSMAQRKTVNMCEHQKRPYFYIDTCLLYTSPSPRDQRGSRMPSSA